MIQGNDHIGDVQTHTTEDRRVVDPSPVDPSPMGPSLQLPDRLSPVHMNGANPAELNYSAFQSSPRDMAGVSGENEATREGAVADVGEEGRGTEDEFDEDHDGGEASVTSASV